LLYEQNQCVRASPVELFLVAFLKLPCRFHGASEALLPGSIIMDIGRNGLAAEEAELIKAPSPDLLSRIPVNSRTLKASLPEERLTLSFKITLVLTSIYHRALNHPRQLSAAVDL